MRLSTAKTRGRAHHPDGYRLRMDAPEGERFEEKRLYSPRGPIVWAAVTEDELPATGWVEGDEE